MAPALRMSIQFGLNSDESKQTLGLLRQTLQEYEQRANGVVTSAAAITGASSTTKNHVFIQNFSQTSQTDPMQHDKKAIPSICFVRSVHGLSSPMGWLVSISDLKITLWRCRESSPDLDWQWTLPMQSDLLTSAVLGGGSGPVVVSSKDDINILNLGPNVSGTNCTVASVMKISSPFTNQIAPLEGPEFSGDMFACSSRGQINIHSLASPAPIRSVPAIHTAPVTVLRHNRETSSLLFSGDAKGVVKVWDSRTTTVVSSINAGHTKPVTCIDCKDSNTLLSGAADGRLLVWDLRKMNELLDTIALDGKPILNMRFLRDSGNSSRLAAVSTLKGLYFMNSADLQHPKPATLKVNEKVACPDIAWNTLATAETPVFYCSDIAGVVRSFSGK